MKNITINLVRGLGLAAVLAAGLSVSGQVSAAAQCKGLENSACGKNAACSWVEGYERKDGRKVNAFCRAKPKRTNDKTAQVSKQG